MKTFIISFFLMLGIITMQAQVILNNIEMGSDVPPTSIVMYDFDSYDKVVKLAVGNIQARKTSYINFTHQYQAYVVTYTNKTYKVALIHTDDYESPMDFNKYLEDFVIDTPIFESTRVGDVRDYLKDELLNFYENESSTW